MKFVLKCEKGYYAGDHQQYGLNDPKLTGDLQEALVFRLLGCKEGSIFTEPTLPCGSWEVHGVRTRLLP